MAQQRADLRRMPPCCSAYLRGMICAHEAPLAGMFRCRHCLWLLTLSGLLMSAAMEHQLHIAHHRPLVHRQQQQGLSRRPTLLDRQAQHRSQQAKASGPQLKDQVPRRVKRQ